MSRPRPQRSLELLVPVFRRRAESMLELLRYMGHEPRVWETLRSLERADWLTDHGTGMTSGRRSMHVIGLAVDVVCGRKYEDGEPHLWHCPPECDFFHALGRAAKAEGLTWGGDFGDKPHVQAVPLSKQNEVRSAAYPAAYATAVLRGIV